MGSGKTSTSTSTVQVPPEVLARYNSVNATAQQAASTPFQSYSSDPNAFVAPLTGTQQAGIANTNAAAGQAQPYYQAGAGLTLAGAQAANPTALNGQAIGQYLSPYLSTVLGSTEALTNQQNQQAMAGQLGNAITSGAFGGDRSGIAAANLAQQQQIAGANTYSNIANQGYNTALSTAEQQQGVGLSAEQANLARLQGAGAQLAGLGAGAQSAALQGATAQLTAGQQEQSTQQAGLTALYNQFLQQQAYPFQTSQFLANIAEGTGSLSGSTTSTTQPTGLFGNLLSDRRAKENIREVGKAKNGLKIYSFRYKGDPEKVTHIGFMADEVEKKHPDAVGLAGGLKTVDYDRASRADGGQLVFDPSAGEYGLGSASMPGHPSYVPAPQGGARRIAFQATPPTSKPQGLGALADDYKSVKGAYGDLSDIGSAGKSALVGSANGNTTGLMGAGGSWNPSAGYFADGGTVDDPYDSESDDDLQHREAGLRVGEKANISAPDSASGPVSGALSSQAQQPKYSLGAAPAPSNSSSSNGLGQLGSLVGLGKDAYSAASAAAPYLSSAASGMGDWLAALALKRGGLVPREHHADGDSVGDDDGIYSTEDPRLALPDAPVDLGKAKLADAYRDQMPAPTNLSADYQNQMPAPSKGGLAPVSAPAAPRQLKKVPNVWAQSQYAANDAAAPDDPSFHYQPHGRDDQIVQDAPAPGLAGASVADAPSPGVHTAQMAGMPGGIGKSMWMPPAYNGPRPDTAPDPRAYGTDQAGQAAFIRDYSAYKGVHPNFTLGVGNAEGLRAITPQNPNGASSVDIDPKTGLPFSFGAFQLNVRDGMGVDALRAGIDPRDPKQANLANQFAIDQMVFGGLRPWRGDAAVRAYQQGQGFGGATANAAPSPGLVGGGNAASASPGLAGSFNSFVHGQPDGQTSPNGGMGERALMAVLSGLGAVGSYKGQSGLGALLQGLGAGAHGWMESGKQQADIGNVQSETGLHNAEAGRTNVNAARESVLENGYYIGQDGRMHVIGKDIAGPGIALMGGKPTAANVTAAPSAPVPAATTPAATNAPPAAVPVAPDLMGVGYDGDSANKAKNEVLVGAQRPEDVKQSAEYQDATRNASLKAQDAAPYTRTLATTLAQANAQSGANAPGYGFGTRANMVNALNTTARIFGGSSNMFGDADTGEVLASKVNTLQGLMRAQGADEHSLGAFNALKGANPTLDQPPAASAEIAARLMTDQMKAQDRQAHMEHWKADSPMGTVLGAQSDFTAKNGPEKYDQETNQITNLMLKAPKAFTVMNSGKLSAPQIAEALKSKGYDPALARYFVRGAANGQQ